MGVFVFIAAGRTWTITGICVSAFPIIHCAAVLLTAEFGAKGKILLIFPLFWFLFIDDAAALVSVMRGGRYRSVLERVWYRMDGKNRAASDVPRG